MTEIQFHCPMIQKHYDKWVLNKEKETSQILYEVLTYNSKNEEPQFSDENMKLIRIFENDIDLLHFHCEEPNSEYCNDEDHVIDDIQLNEKEIVTMLSKFYFGKMKSLE